VTSARKAKLVDELYDTIGNGGFAALPRLLAEVGGGRSCSFQVIDADAKPRVVESSYFDPQMNRYYVDEGIYRHDIWQRQTDRAPRGRALDLLEYVPDTQYVRSRFYQDMIRRFGDDTGRCLGMLIPIANGGLIGIGIHRAFKDRPFEDSDAAALDGLMPHLERVVGTQLRLDEADASRATWEATLETMPQAALVLSPGCTVTLANARARAILRRSDGLSLIQNRLELAVATEHERYAKCLHEALRREGARGGAVLVSRSGARRPYSLVVHPFEAGERTNALVLIVDPDGERASRGELLRQLYRLTGAEADVALMVSSGMNIEDVANQRGVTGATAKTLLQRAYQKTAVSKASELARLVAELPG